MENKLRDVVTRATRGWSDEEQMLVAIEELGELSTALAKYLNDRPSNVEEEICDVIIMIEQLKIIFEASNLDIYLDRKLDKLDNKMKRYGF